MKTTLEKPIYKNKKFKNELEFRTWLKEKTKYHIRFEDKGQDFLEWWIDERGEVLHCAPFQAFFWNGLMIVPESIKKGSYIEFQNGKTLNYKTKFIY